MAVNLNNIIARFALAIFKIALALFVVILLISTFVLCKNWSAKKDAKMACEKYAIGNKYTPLEGAKNSFSENENGAKKYIYLYYKIYSNSAKCIVTVNEENLIKDIKIDAGDQD